MTATAMTPAHAHCAIHEATQRPVPLWKRVVSFDVVVLRRLGLLMLGAGALLAFLPIHPGLLCPLRATTGVPCPLCGMTTSVKSSLRLDLPAALAANPAGLTAVILALALVVWRPARLRVPLLALVAAGAGMWLFQMFRFSVL